MLASINRLQFVGWIVVLLIAVLLGALIFREAGNSQAFYEHQASQRAREYRDTAGVHAEASCAHLTRPEIRPCVHQEYHAARERERQEGDLQAQLVSSVWTRAMGIAAIIAMVIGIAGVGLVYLTFEATRGSVRAFIAAERGFISQTDLRNHLLRVSTRGRTGIELQSIHWAALRSPSYPAKWTVFEVQRCVSQLEPGQNLHSAGFVDYPDDAGFVGGWIVYRSRFPGDEHRAYFLSKVMPAHMNDHGEVIAQDEAFDPQSHGWPKST